MQKPNKCWATWLLCMLFFGAACAQNSNSTIEQAIEIARANKSGELGLRPAARADSEPLVSLPKTVRAQTAAPKVWSITGVGRDLTAEVIYEGKVYPLSLVRDQVRAGPWMLLRLSTHSADFAYLPTGKRWTEKTPVVQAFPPSDPAQMQSYFEAPMALTTPVASVGVGAGALGARPPLPPELMRPAMQP